MYERINPFAVHYFLWFSALTSIYGYISVYAEHYANASSSQYGLLNMLLPFVTILTKLYFCSLADRHRAHRTFFVVFLVAALVGYGSFGILPFFISPQPKELGLNAATWTLICLMTSVATIAMSVISCLSDAFAVNSSKNRKSSYGMIRLWGTIGWGISSFVIAFINQIDKLPLLVPGLLMTIALLVVDVLIAALWPNAQEFTLDQSCADVDVDDVVSAISQRQNLNNQRVSSHYGSNVRASSTQLDYITPPSSPAPRRMATDEKITYQQAKQGIDSNPLRTVSRSQRGSSNGTTANPHQTMVIVSNSAIQWMLFKEVAKARRSLFHYMVLFTISGALTSLQWSYFFLYLKNIYSADFAFISGLSMVGQSMLGELPFFLISERFIKLFGRAHTLSLSIIAIGVRYLLYNFLLPNSNMYFVLLTEALQGPCFGLFYVVMTETGLDYSDCDEAIVKVIDNGLVPNERDQIEKLRMALRATMQSLMSACYEGLGLGIGSIAGGLIIDYYGFEKLWTGAACVAIFLGAINSLVELIGWRFLTDTRASRRPKKTSATQTSLA